MPAYRRSRVPRPTVTVLLLACAVMPPTGQTLAAAVSDFCFLHISDMHFSPVPFGADKNAEVRGSDVLAWLCEEAHQAQKLDPFGIRTPPPAFVAATGDITEYGVINETWDAIENVLKALRIPLYITPGNHDNTWTSIQPVMRRKHGSDHYSFDRSGCHFTFIDTATPQEPLPSIEQRTLTWLAKDLEKVSRTTPVFVFCHHPLSSDEFAAPYEQLRLIELLETRNVVLLLMGHGHGARHERWGAIDSVMGGSTFGPNAGFGIVSVINGVLRCVYRFHDSSKPVHVLLEKPIAPLNRPTLEFLTISQNLNGKKARPAVRTSGVAIRVRIQGGRPRQVTASIDGDDKSAVKLAENATSGVFAGSLPVRSLAGGQHFLRVVADFGDYQIDRAREFTCEGKDSPLRCATVELTAGVKAAPLFADGDVIACTTAGQVVKVSFKQPQPAVKELLNTGVEILHSPALAAGTLYVSAAEKGIHAIGLDGKRLWQWPGTGAAVYGTPALDNSRVYAGDLEGFVHAIDRKSGKTVWSKRHATFSIEQPLLLHDGRLYFGAWDGLLYCIDAREGSLVWKKPGPAGHLAERVMKSRYYSPADCPPLIAGSRLFDCDRAYRLGSYSLTGEYVGEIAKNVAAIGPTADDKGFYARGLSEGVSRYDSSGRIVWANDKLPMGRFPVAPVEAAGRVYACSNRGLLCALDAADGKLLWKYQVTPQLHVMAGAATDGKGRVCVAGMDGTVNLITQ